MQAMLDEAMIEMDDGLDILIEYISLLRDRISYLMSQTYITEKVQRCLMALNCLVVPIALAITIAYGANNMFSPNSKMQEGLQKIITCFMFVSGFFGLPFYMYTLWDIFVGDDVKVEKAFTFGAPSNMTFCDENIQPFLENASCLSASPSRRSSVKFPGLGKRVESKKVSNRGPSSWKSLVKLCSSDGRLSRRTGSVRLLGSQDLGDEETEKYTLENKDKTTKSPNSKPDVEILQDEITDILCSDSGEGNVLHTSSASLDRVAYFDEFCNPCAIELAAARSSAKISSNEVLDTLQEREDTFMEETSAKVPATVSWAKADSSGACKTEQCDKIVLLETVYNVAVKQSWELYSFGM